MKKTFLSVLGIVIAFTVSSQNSFASDTSTDCSFLIQKLTQPETVKVSKEIKHPRRDNTRKKHKTATCKRIRTGW